MYPTRSSRGCWPIWRALHPRTAARENSNPALGLAFEARARQNLRRALFRLRRVLGQNALISEGGGCPGCEDVAEGAPRQRCAGAAAGPAAAGGHKDCLRSATPLTAAAAIAHSKQRNIDLSRMSSDKQEADAVQRRQRKPFEITILRPSAVITSIAPNASSPANRTARHLPVRSARKPASGTEMTTSQSTILVAEPAAATGQPGS
jgi:hypothetical protein